MGTALVALGVLAWFLFSIISYVFLTPLPGNIAERLRQATKIRISKETGPKFGISLMQIAGIFWVIIGLVKNLIGDSFLKGVGGDILLRIIFLAPIWIGAIVVERRKTKGL